MALRISDLAREGGVGVETVRFYQRKGLLDAPDGAATGGRHYGSRKDDRARAREMARERIAALDEQIATLEEARRSLARLAKDCAKGGEGPCPILAAFDGK